MADHSFTVIDLLAVEGCTLNAPPFTKGESLSKRQTTQTKRICKSKNTCGKSHWTLEKLQNSE